MFVLTPPCISFLSSQGDVGKDWYIILEGSVDIQKDGVSVRHLARGMWFGESAAVTGNAVRNADCVATIKSDLLVVRAHANEICYWTLIATSLV